MGISAYLKELVSDTKVLGVIMQETLADDMKRLFNITVVKQIHSKYSSGYSKFLSSRAKNNLHKYLDSDFKCSNIVNIVGTIHAKWGA